jgi:hypothetical protein
MPLDRRSNGAVVASDFVYQICFPGEAADPMDQPRGVGEG